MVGTPWIEILFWAALAFGAVKGLFTFLGWYSQIGRDAVYRRHLDEIWDQLNEGTIFEFVRSLLGRSVRKIQEAIPNRRKALWLAILFSSLVIFSTLIVSAEVFEVIVQRWPEYVFRSERELREGQYFLGKGSLSMFFPGDAPFGKVEPLLTALILIPFGALFYVFSMFVSWRLLKNAASARSLGSIIANACANLAVVLLAMIAVNLVHAATAIWVSRTSDPLGILGMSWSETAYFFWFNNVMFLTILTGVLTAKPPTDLTLFELRGVMVGLSISLPTLLYVFVNATLMAARMTPKTVQVFITNCIFLITTDKTPVFTQLGNVAGACAGSAAAIVSALSRFKGTSS